MYDEDEVECRLVGDAIEDEHGLDGEMPGACSVGSGHDDGDASHDEGDEGTLHAEPGGEVEAEEGEVVMEEIAQPDGEAVERKQTDAAHVTHGDDTRP